MGLFQLRDNGLNALHERQGALRSRGEPAKSGRLPGNGCGVLVTMPPNSTDVKELLLNGGVAENAAPGTLSIDMTSGAPGGSGEICAALKKRGIRFVDAPVSGGEPMAVEGTLAIMTGGEREDFERARAVFDAVGRSATWGGSVGSGNACKPVNQIIVALNIAALSEGLMPAKKAGADTQLVFEAIRGGLAGSAVMNAKTPMILADNFKPGFRIDLHIKDLTNAMNTGALVDAPLPLTAGIPEIMKRLSAEGGGLCDHSGIARHCEEPAGRKYSE